MTDPFTLLPLDKQAHVLAGMCIALIFASFGHPLVGFCMAVIAGAVKEWVYDKRVPGHTSDVKDFFATAAGGAVGALIGAFVHLL